MTRALLLAAWTSRELYQGRSILPLRVLHFAIRNGKTWQWQAVSLCLWLLCTPDFRNRSYISFLSVFGMLFSTLLRLWVSLQISRQATSWRNFLSVSYFLGDINMAQLQQNGETGGDAYLYFLKWEIYMYMCIYMELPRLIRMYVLIKI